MLREKQFQVQSGYVNVDSIGIVQINKF